MFELVSLKPGLTHLFSFVSQGCRAGHLQLHQSHLCTIRGAHWRQVHRKPVEDDSGAAAFSCVISCVLLRLRLHRVMNSGSCSFGNHLPLDGRIVPSMSHRDSIFELHHFLLGLCYSSFRFCCPTLKPKLLVTSQFWFCTPVILLKIILICYWPLVQLPSSSSVWNICFSSSNIKAIHLSFFLSNSGSNVIVVLQF